MLVPFQVWINILRPNAINRKEKNMPSQSGKWLRSRSASALISTDTNATLGKTAHFCSFSCWCLRAQTMLSDLSPLNPTATLHTQGWESEHGLKKSTQSPVGAPHAETLTFRTDYVTTCSRVSKARTVQQTPLSVEKGSIEFHLQVYPHFKNLYITNFGGFNDLVC